jgi:hypothetical protein
MSIQQNFPAISPSLNLNFARSKTLDPRITFTRTSSATRVNGQGLIEVVPTNAPRFDHSYDPVSGTVRSLGLLVEEARSNFVFLSGRPDVDKLFDISGGNGLSFIDGEIVTSNVGSLSGTYVASASSPTKMVLKYSTGTPAGTVTGSQSGATRTIGTNYSVGGGAVNIFNDPTTETLSPDGTTNAFLISPSTSGSQLRTTSKRYVTSTVGTYTYSIFFKNKNITNNLVAIYIGNQTSLSNVVANFNVSTKTFGGVGQNGGWTGSVGYQDYPNGWIRIWVTATTTEGSHTSLDGTFWLGGYQGVTETAGSMYVWESQIEQGAFPTSQIKTLYSTATRTADNASMRGENFSSWYNPNEGTLLTNVNLPVRILTGARSFALDDGTTTYMMDLTNTLNTFTLEALENSSYVNIISISNSTSKIVKQATSFNNSSQTISVNGEVTSPSSTSLSINRYSNLRIGTQVNNTAYLNGTISQLTYYPKRLPNAFLQNLTK